MATVLTQFLSSNSIIGLLYIKGNMIMSCRSCAHITISNIETSSALHVIVLFCILCIKAKVESKCKKGKEAHISRLRAVIFCHAIRKESNIQFNEQKVGGKSYSPSEFDLNMDLWLSSWYLQKYRINHCLVS